MSQPIQLPLKVIAETAEYLGFDVGKWSPSRGDIPQVASHAEVHRLMMHLQPQQTDEPLAILIGRACRPFDFGIPSRIARHCPTLRRAVKRYIYFQTLAAPGCSCLKPASQPEGTEILVAPSPPMDPELEASRPFRSVYPMAFAMANLRRLADDDDIGAVQVDVMASDDGWAQQYRRFFGASIEFGCPENRLYFDSETLDRPVVGADPEVVPYLERLALKEFEQFGHRPGTPETTEDLIRAQLEEAILEGAFDLVDMARRLNVSERTLQRRLKDEGVSYRELVDEVRRDLAIELLRAPEHTIHQIAAKLGYNHPASFSRAFKRWTGQPPGKFRSVFAEGA